MFEIVLGVFAVVLALVLLRGLRRAWSIGAGRPPLTTTWGTEDLRFKAEELRVKTDTDARKDAIQTVLGVAVLFTFAGTVATVIQGREKMEADKWVADAKYLQDQKKYADEKALSDARYAQEQEKIAAEQYARLLADLGSDSHTRQAEAINRLLPIWKRDGVSAAADHMRTLAIYLRLSAPLPLKPTAPPQNWKYGDFFAVERSRPHIQMAVNALSALNEINHQSTHPTVIEIKDVDLRDLQFPNLCLDDLEFGGCLLANSNFTDCSMRNIRAHAAWLEEARLIRAHLNGAHLDGCHVTSSTNFSGADVDRATLKDSSNDEGESKLLVLERPPTGKLAINPNWQWATPNPANQH